MTRWHHLTLVAVLAVAGACRAADRAPALPADLDWREVGDTLLFAGASWDSLDAYWEAMKTRAEPAVKLRLGLVLALQPDRYREAVPHLIEATADPRDRGSRELLAWIAAGSDEAVAVGEEARHLTPRDPVERAASFLGALHRGGDLADLLAIWPAPEDRPIGMPGAPMVDPIAMLQPETKPGRHTVAPLQGETVLATAPPIDWRAKLLPTGMPRTLPHGGTERARLFHLAAGHLIAKQQKALATDAAMAGLPLATGSVAADLAFDLALIHQADRAEHDRWLERALRAEPRHVPSLHEKAAGALVLRRWAEARATLERLLAVSPRDPLAMERLAVVQKELGQPGRALRWARRAAEADPPSVRRLLLLADLLAALGDERGSAEHRRRAALESCKEFLRPILGPGMRKSFSIGPVEAVLDYVAGRAEQTLKATAGRSDARLVALMRRRGSWLAPQAALALGHFRFERGDWPGALEAAARARETDFAALAYWSTRCESHLLAASAHERAGSRADSERELAAALDEARNEGEPLHTLAATEVARFRRLVREGVPAPALSLELDTGIEVQDLKDDATGQDFGSASLALADWLLARDRPAEALAILRTPKTHSIRSLLLRAHAEWRSGDSRQAAAALLAAGSHAALGEPDRRFGKELAVYLEDPSGPAAGPREPRSAAATSPATVVALEWLGRADPVQAARALERVPDLTHPDERLLGISKAWEELVRLRRRYGAEEGAARAARRAAACALAAGSSSRARSFCRQAWATPHDTIRRLRTRLDRTDWKRGLPAGQALVALAALAVAAVLLAGFRRLSVW